jgi:hypothetical protein
MYFCWVARPPNSVATSRLGRTALLGALLLVVGLPLGSLADVAAPGPGSGSTKMSGGRKQLVFPRYGSKRGRGKG